MRQAVSILLSVLGLGACVGRSGTVDEAPPPPAALPTDGADSRSKADSAAEAGGEPSRRVRISGRTGPYTGHPLFVIDGVTYESSSDSLELPAAVADLAPEEIESIEVLKGAPALERYGARARDGVIVIQTRRGALRSAPR